MQNDERLGQMIAGALLIQELLIRRLEIAGVLEQGDFRATLQQWMDGVSPERHSEPMYQPVYLLMKKLDEASGDPQRTH